METLDFLEKRGYTVERCLDPEDERYRLMRGNEIILDDSACLDYYGSMDDVAEYFAEYVREYVMPGEKQVEDAISKFDNSMGYTIVQSIDVAKDVKLMTFISDNGTAKSSTVVYDDGTIFVTDDWQGCYAECFEDIEDYDWHLLNNLRVAIVDGLPRLLY